MKPFKTLDQQLSILESRGLVITDKKFTKTYLLENNYYNIVNMYSKFFQTNENKYIPGTKFEEIKALHIYDTEVKTILLKHIIIAEKYFKSIFTYYFSEAYPDEPFAYLDINNYPNAKPIILTRTFSDISKTIHMGLKSSKKNAIKHYNDRYGVVPMWVLVNELTFRNIIHLYKYTSDKIRNKIAKKLAQFLSSNVGAHIVLEPRSIDSMLGNLVQIRNCVAHDNKLLGFKCNNHLVHIPLLHDKYDNLSTHSRQSVFFVFLALQCFLPYENYYLLHNSIRKRTIDQVKNLNSISINTVLQSYGFPNNWHETTAKMSQK